MIDPTYDPVFSNPDLQKLLMTFNRDQVGRIAQDLSSIGYTTRSVQYDHQDDKFTAGVDVPEPEKNGLWDVAQGAAALENFSGRAIWLANRFVSRSLGNYGYETDKANALNDFKVDDWFAQPGTRKYLQSLPGSQGQNIVRNWITGDYNGINKASDFFAAVGYDTTEAQYRDAMANADAFSGIAGGLLGAGADPLGVIGGAAIVNVGGKALVLFNAAEQAAVAARLTALGVRISKTDSVASAVGKSMLAGTAYTAVTETGLHALDRNRTLDQTVDNLAGNILFNSALSAGLGAVSGAPLLKPKTTFHIGPQEAPHSLASIDAEVGKVMQQKIDEALGGLKVEEPKAPTPLLTTDRPNPEMDVPVSGKDILSNYGRKLAESAATPQVEPGVGVADAVAQRVHEIVTGEKAPDDFSKLIDEVLAAKKEMDTARVKRAAGITEEAPSSMAPAPTPADAPVIDPLAADPTAGTGPDVVFSSEKKGTEVPDVGSGNAPENTQPSNAVAGTSAPSSIQPKAQKPVEAGIGGRTTGYTDYLPDLEGIPGERMQQILNLTDKYLNNRVGGRNWTVNSVQFTTNPQLAMMYQKMFRSIFPSKAATQGLVQGAPPFEAVAGMMRKKGLSVQNVLSETFRQLVRDENPGLYTRLITDHSVGRETWSWLPGARELVAKEQAFYEAMDVLRALKASDLEHLPDSIDASKFLSPAKEIGVQSISSADLMGLLTESAQNGTLSSLLGHSHLVKASGADVIDTLQKIFANPNLVNRVTALLDDDLGALGNLRERLRPQGAKYESAAVDNLRKDYSLAQTSVSLPDNMTMQEFNKLLNAAYGSGDTPETLLRYFIENFKSIDQKELTAPTQATVNRLRNTFYNEMGGFVLRDKLVDAMGVKRVDGSRLVSLDLRRTIGLNVRLNEQLELAHTLRDYIAEATQWDGRLKEQIREAGEMQAPKTLLDSFDQLTAIQAMKGKVEPQSGYFQELRAWNERALSTIETHMRDTALENNLNAKGNEIPQPVREKEKTLIGNFFQNIRTRTDMAANPSTAEAHILKRNVTAFTRNLFLGSQGLTNTQDLGQAVAATALSPFRGDFQAGFNAIAADLRKAKLQGRDMGALLDNIEFVADELRDVVLNRTSQGEWDPTLTEDIRDFSPAQKLASFQEKTAAGAIQAMSLGQTVMDTSKSMALLGTIHQLTYKDGLIVGMNKVLGDVKEGMSLADSLKKNNVPAFYANQALKYLSASDISEIAGLIKNDVTKDISTPRRFFLNSFMGEKKLTLLDLPENSTAAQRSAMESLGMLANDLATREKMAMPGWGDDMLGSNSTSKQILSFWWRPNIALFNRAFMGQAHKPVMARFGIMGTMLMMSAAIDLAKAASNGPDALDKKLAAINGNFYGWAANRVGWSGATGWAGEKGINFALAMLDPQPGQAMLGAPGQREITPAPFGAMGTLAQGLLGGIQSLSPKGTTRPNADALWKVLSSTGAANDSLTFKLMGTFGRVGGVYGDENNSVDIKKFWYDRLGVPADQRR